MTGRSRKQIRSRRAQQIRENVRKHDVNKATREARIQIRYLKNRIREKRKLLRKVAVMTKEELLEHKRTAMSAKNIKPERRARLAGMGPDTFRQVWMAGLRKTIHDLKDIIPDAPDA